MIQYAIMLEKNCVKRGRLFCVQRWENIDDNKKLLLFTNSDGSRPNQNNSLKFVFR